MKKGLKPSRLTHGQRKPGPPSKLMPWWRRDWNGARTADLNGGKLRPVNWCPDEEGIETHRPHPCGPVPLALSKLMPWWRRDWNFPLTMLDDISIFISVNWCPDEEGIETLLGLTQNAGIVGIAVNWCPDEEGIETYCKVQLQEAEDKVSKLMPWWRRDWNFAVIILTAIVSVGQ